MDFSKVTGITLGLLCCIMFAVAMKQPKCRGQAIHMKEEDMKAMSDCVKEVVPTADGEDPGKASKAIPKEKMACFGKCMLEKEGLIDDKGMPSKDSLMSKINSTMPAEVMEDLDSAITKCVDEHGSKADPADTTCQSYQPLTQCMTVAFVEVCKVKEP